MGKTNDCVRGGEVKKRSYLRAVIYERYLRCVNDLYCPQVTLKAPMFGLEEMTWPDQANGSGHVVIRSGLTQIGCPALTVIVPS